MPLTAGLFLEVVLPVADPPVLAFSAAAAICVLIASICASYCAT